MNNYLKESLWFFMPLLLAIVISITVLRYDPRTAPVFNLNIYDAYLLVEPLYLISAIATVLGFIIALPRAIILKFGNTYSNYILMVYTALLILFISYIIHINIDLGVKPGWTIYPPLSAKPKIEIKETTLICNSVYLVLQQCAAIALLRYTAYRTGKNKNPKSISTQS